LKLSFIKTLAALTSCHLHQSLQAQTPKISPSRSSITQSGAKNNQNFPAASQLKGWVISKDGRYTILFSIR